MSDTFVIHWADKRHIGLHALIGDESALIRAVRAGDEFTADQITKIERYDSDPPGTAEVVSLEDVAQAIARLAEIDQPTGATITSAVRDFIEHNAGLAWARGLIVADGFEHAA